MATTRQALDKTNCPMQLINNQKVLPHDKTIWENHMKMKRLYEKSLTINDFIATRFL